MEQQTSNSLKNNNVWTITVILLGVLLFAVLFQPVWRGEEMLGEFRLDCDKRGGVFLEHKRLFGTNYQCKSRLD